MKGIWIRSKECVFYSEFKSQEITGESFKIITITLFPVIGNIVQFDYLQKKENDLNQIVKGLAIFSNRKTEFCVASYNLENVNDYDGDWLEGLNKLK